MKFLDKLQQRPKVIDAVILTCLTVVIVWQPYLLHHEIIMMEIGLYLPAINEVFHGGLPYKDFLIWRGPLELYVPALLMLIFGKNMIWMPIFYYMFTILTLCAGVWIGYLIYRTRFILYLMVPVFAARTFPRVGFYFWGGMRYFLGLLCLFFSIQCFRKKRLTWMFAAGICSALAFLTTIESGFSAAGGITAGLIFCYIFNVFERDFIFRAFQLYAFGFLLVILPYFFYLWNTGSLPRYLETIFWIPQNLMKVLVDEPANRPQNIGEFFTSFIPESRHFKIMTPVFCYIFLLGYLIFRIKRGKINWELYPLISLGTFGLILYIAAFRMIWGAQFEMALQPEKILLFFLLEEAYLWIRRKRGEWAEKLGAFSRKGLIAGMKKIVYANVVGVLAVVLTLSSWWYAASRFNHRFVMAKWLQNTITGRAQGDLSLLAGQKKRSLNIERAKGMVVPVWQAEEIEAVVGFLQKHTTPNEPVFAYPELGNFNFWADRPLVGRFGVATHSWLREEWHQELLEEFQKVKPRYVIMTNLGHRTFPEKWYFRYPPNKQKFEEFTNLILSHYKKIKQFTSVSIYEIKASKI